MAPTCCWKRPEVSGLLLFISLLAQSCREITFSCFVRTRSAVVALYTLSPVLHQLAFLFFFEIATLPTRPTAQGNYSHAIPSRHDPPCPSCMSTSRWGLWTRGWTFPSLFLSFPPPDQHCRFCRSELGAKPLEAN